MGKGRKDESQTNGQGKGTFRFRYMDSNRQFEVQADNVSGESLLEGFRHVANAIAGSTLPVAPARRLPENAGASARAAEILDEKEKEATATDVLPFPEDSEPAALEDDPEEENTEVAPRRKKTPKGPKVLTDINLTSAKVPLADFLAQKNITETLDKYAAVAVWYKQEFGITEITIDRIWTAFKLLGQESQLPTDVEKPLQNLTYRKEWFKKLKAPGAYEIIWTGEDAVNKIATAKSVSA